MKCIPRMRYEMSTKQQEDVRRQKDKIQSLSIEDKRKLYKCKQFTILADVPSWKLDPDHQKGDEKLVELSPKISIFPGDITTLEIDAIVNAAKESLLGGGGVDGAIHSAASKWLAKECRLHKGCEPGYAEITCGYNLPAKWVIHTVGPRDKNPEVLRRCYHSSLNLMRDHQLTSVAFPCISTGAFGYPRENAAEVALTAVCDWLKKDDYAHKVERILFCLFSKRDVEIYREKMQQLIFPISNLQTTVSYKMETTV